MTTSLSEQAEVDPTFDNALRGLRATGASVGTQELVELLALHGSEEGAVLATYEELASESDDDSVKYLIALILDDERRHHRLLAEMANAMAWGAIKTNPEPATPGMSSGMDASLLAQTKRLRRFEEEDSHNLVQLRKRLKSFADTTLWSLIVDLLLLDTKKHTTILRFLETHQGGR